MYPGEVEAKAQFVLGGPKQTKNVQILALFEREELLAAIPNNGIANLDAVCQLKTGQYIYADGKVLVFGPPKWKRRF